MKYNSGGFTPPEKKARRITIILISIFILVIASIVGVLIFLAQKGKIEVKLEIIISIISIVISLTYYLEKVN